MQILKKTKKRQVFAVGVFIALFFLAFFSFHTYTKTKRLQPIQEDQMIEITGAVVDQEVPASSSEKQIGLYTLYPSFSFPEPFSISGEYDTLQKQIRDFHQEIKTCREQDTERSLEDCFSLTLEKATYDSWHIEEDCETEEEKIFYDFTELFARCLQSDDEDCVCSSSFSSYHPSSVGEYSFSFVAEENLILVTFQETSLEMLFPSLLLIVGETSLSSETYTLHVDASETVGGFSSLQPSNALYLYKQDEQTLFVEDQTTFSTFSTTRDACAVPEKKTYKFCVQSDQTISSYDASLQSTITQPMVYVFALAFP